MKKLKENRYAQILIAVGFLTIIFGMALHVSMPSSMKHYESNQGNWDFMLPNNSYGQKIETNHNDTTNDRVIQFTGYLYAGEEINCSILIINKTEYEAFNKSLSVDSIKPIKKLEGIYDYSNHYMVFKDSFPIIEDGDIYFLALKNSSKSTFVFFTYRCTDFHPSYYTGISIMLMGLFLSCLFLMSFLHGWKRYLVLGISINFFTFLMAIALFPYYIDLTSVADNFHLEMYSDYDYYYLDWADTFSDGAFPYSSDYNSYIYGPLFILTIGAFGFLSIHPWKLAIPLFLATIGTGYYIYKIMFKITNNEKKATFSMLLYYLNPFTLIYASYTWLNPPFFIFFSVLAFYLALSDKKHAPYLSMISLGIAIMYKQFAFIFFPILLIFLMKKIHERKAGEMKHYDLHLFKVSSEFISMALYAITFGATVLIISLPFLIVDPTRYLNSILFGRVYYFDRLTMLETQIGSTVNFNSFLMLIDVPDILITIIAYLLAYWVLLGGSMIFIYFYYSRNTIKRSDHTADEKIKLLMAEALFLSIILIFCIQLFYPRGTYKFYLILLAPFISCMYDPLNLHLIENSNENEFKFHVSYIFPLLISWSIFFSHRHLYFVILFIWMFFLILLFLSSSSQVLPKHSKIEISN